MTVERPGVARARFGNEESKRRICNHIDPRRGSPQTFPQDGHILAAISANPPRPLKNRERLGKRHVHAFGLTRWPWDDGCLSFCPLRSSDLLRQRTSPAEQYRSPRLFETARAPAERSDPPVGGKCCRARCSSPERGAIGCPAPVHPKRLQFLGVRRGSFINDD